jgi:hypothetical protein
MNASNYAFIQNAEYDPKNNLILYGKNTYMKAFGVSDGTSNQISEYILRSPCGCGTAGGNPFNKNIYIDDQKEFKNLKSFEQFENTKSSKLTKPINLIILFLVILLIYSYFTTN